MGEQTEERACRAALYPELPRGPKRPEWEKKEVLQSLADAAKDLGENQIGRVINPIRERAEPATLRSASP